MFWAGRNLRGNAVLRLCHCRPKSAAQFSGIAWCAAFLRAQNAVVGWDELVRSVARGPVP